MHPREDDRASLRNLNYLQSNLAGLVETVVLDDSYHVVTLDRQRQLVVSRTLDFVSQLHDSSARRGAEAELDGASRRETLRASASQGVTRPDALKARRAERIAGLRLAAVETAS